MATRRAEYRFTVKEGTRAPFIMCEPTGRAELPLPVGAFLGLDLKEGTTEEEAREVARFLNKHIRSVTLTD